MASTDPHTTLYMPIVSPPTPAPSPPPDQPSFPQTYIPPIPHTSKFSTLSPSERRQHLHALIQECTPSELLFLSTTIAPLLKRDFLRALPPEVSLHVLSFIDDPRTLARAARVSRYWNELLKDDYVWRSMCIRHGFARDADAVESFRRRYGVPTPAPLPLANVDTGAEDGEEDFENEMKSSRPYPVGLQPARANADGFPYRQFYVYEHLRSAFLPHRTVPSMV